MCIRDRLCIPYKYGRRLLRNLLLPVARECRRPDISFLYARLPDTVSYTHLDVYKRQVLQRERPVKIWGNADKGENVTVVFKKKKCSTVAGEDGKWRVELPPMKLSLIHICCAQNARVCANRFPAA